MRNIFIYTTVVASLFIGSRAFAQPQQPSQLPIDPLVRVGTLPNGLRYYIRKNDSPKQRAEFFIAQKVGSMLENETQLGLAHFLEHMAFNGSKNFPGGNLVKYLETIGVKFGENVNAYTAFDETVYNISNVPTTRSSIVDSALLVLHDWSNFISLEGKEIDKERGVIREEWRTRNSGSNRVMNAYVKDIFPNSITGNRMPIGSIDIINTFSHQQLRDYYRQWYRPDLQAIIIVGDINVDDIEVRIKSLFADISKPINPAERTYVSIANNHEPLVAIATDVEVNSTSVSLIYKKDVVPFAERNTSTYYLNNIAQSIITTMLNERFVEISRQSNPPFQGASSRYDNFVVSISKDAWSTGASAKSGESLSALKAIVRENERMRRFGFCASELERVKIQFLSYYQSQYNERDKQKHSSYVGDYIKNFTTNEPIPGVEFEYNLVSRVLPTITIDMINKLAMSYVTDTNMVVVVTGPRKDGVFTPSKEDVLAAIAEVKKEAITPYLDKLITKPLLASLPKSGKVVKTEKASFGYTKWTLSNGVKVYLKKTDFKKDQILMFGYSDGGTSLMDIKDRPNYSVINEVVSLGGLGEFDPLDLNKLLSGKIANVSASVGSSNESLNGSASPKYFETLMQLTYLKFTQPRKDEVAFSNFVSRKRNQLENAALNPSTAFSDSIRGTVYNHHPLMSKFDVNMLKQVDYTRVIELYKQRFANAGDFNFIFTGNVEFDVVKSYVETYLGGLPSTGKNEKWKDLGIRMVKGSKTVDFEKVLSVPKTSVFASYSGKATYSIESDVLMKFVSSILNFRYTEAIREKEGGSYGVSVRGSVDIRPIEQYNLQISFDTDPKLKAKLLAIVHREIKSLIENGPSLEDVNKVKEFMLKKNQEMQTENGYWQNALNEYLNNKVDVSSFYMDIVQCVTPFMVQRVAKEWLTQGNVVEVLMSPKKGN